MSFEDFDKKIREAADHHHPAYDEKAWMKMQRKLDKHLPQQKDDRRRLLLLVLLFLLIGGGITVFITQPWKQASPLATVTTDNNSTGKPVSNPATLENQQDDDAITATNEEVRGPVVIVPGQLTVSLDPTAKVTQNMLVADQQEKGSVILLPVGIDNKNIADNLQTGNPVSTDQKNTTIIEPSNVGLTKEDQSPVKQNATQPVTEQSTQQTNKTAKNKKSNSFFFSLSAGPDLSAASWGSPGKVKLLGGVGIGYTFRERLTIKTGFYTGRKVYSASPAEYNPPATFWNYYPGLNKVEADCKIYEIPVQFNYNFASSARQNWFAGAGISSYLMKNETYIYHYKDPTSGQPASRNWTIKDENNHLFSTLTISGGYQRHLSNRVSITAEPYIKLPLSGVGYGRVNLTSAGLMLSATVKPFGKK